MAKKYFLFILIVSGLMESQGGIILQPRGFQRPQGRLGYSLVPQRFVTAEPVVTGVKIKQVPEQTVSYSLSSKDYHYLQQHKDEGGSPFDPDPIHDPDYLHIENYHQTEHKDSRKQVKNPPKPADVKVAASEVLASSVRPEVFIDHSPPTAAFAKPIVSEEVLENIVAPKLFINPSFLTDTFANPIVSNEVLESSVAPEIFTNPGHLTAALANPSVSNEVLAGSMASKLFINPDLSTAALANPIVSEEVLENSVGPEIIIDERLPTAALIKPVVNKHVYFHVPPPGFEEEPRVSIALTPQRKHYNILFIKAPSQEPNYAQLQQILQNRSPEEQKTLIYVLSKQQEQALPVVLPPKTVSVPEVYFLKYKVNSADVTKINSELCETSSLQSVAPLLEPRFGQDKP